MDEFPTTEQLARSREGCRYIWDVLPRSMQSGLPLRPLVQTKDGCNYASCSRLVEYDVTTRFGKAGHTCPVQFDHFLWQKAISKHHPLKPSQNFNAINLLRLVEGGYVNHALAAQRFAIPIKLEETYFDYRINKAVDCMEYDEIRSTMSMPPFSKMTDLLLEKNIPLAVTVPVLADYPNHSEKPYSGFGHDGRSYLSLAPSSPTHSVVVVGVYDPPPQNPHGIDTSKTFYIYQNSVVEDDYTDLMRKSFLPYGMNLLNAELIQNVCHCVNYPNLPLLQHSPPGRKELADMKSHFAKVADRETTADKIDWLLRNQLSSWHL